MSQPSIFDVTSETFDRLVLESSHDKPVLVDFWAPSCAPCKALLPMLISITDNHAGNLLLAKVNCDEQITLVERFGIRTLPTVVLFRHGQPVDGFADIQPTSVILDMLAAHL